MPYFIPSLCNLCSKKWRFCKKTHFFPRFWWRHYDVIMRCQIFLNDPMTQFRSRSSKRVVAQPSILFGSSDISSANLVKSVTPLIYLSIVYPQNEKFSFFWASVLANLFEIWPRNFLWFNIYSSAYYVPIFITFRQC